MTLHGYNYTYNSPVNFTDPTGYDPMFGTSSINNTTDLFNFQVIPAPVGMGIRAYIQINYQSQPWRKYTSHKAPRLPQLVPIRHPLNLDYFSALCLEQTIQMYASGEFFTWEVNARNIVVEMKGTILSQKEWALRDAIGMAYVPYNRVEFNNNQPSNNKHPYIGYRFGSYENRNDALGMLLSGEFAVSSDDNNAYLSGISISTSYEKVYHFALVVAYGVHHKYFQDTSYGATGYFHRPEHCSVTGTYYDYMFFRNQRIPNYNLRRNTPSSEELEEAEGWSKWMDNPMGVVQWITPYPSVGCEYPNN